MRQPLTQRSYLSALRLHLSPWYSPEQLRTVAAEQALRFACGMDVGHSEEEICRELGPPGRLAAEIRRAKRGDPGWGSVRGAWTRAIPAVLVLLLLELAHWPVWLLINVPGGLSDYGIYLHLTALPVLLILFWYLRPYLKGAWTGLTPGCVVLHGLVIVPMLLLLALYYLACQAVITDLQPFSSLPLIRSFMENPEAVGPFLIQVLSVAILVTVILLGYAAARVVGGEARFIPVLLHGMGALGCLRYLGYLLTLLMSPDKVRPELLYALSLYLRCLLLALVCAGVLAIRWRRASKHL